MQIADNGNIYPNAKDKNNYVGVEIEFFSAVSHEKYKIIFQRLIRNRKVNIAYDLSIRGRSEKPYQIELKVIDTEKNIYKTIRKICSIIKKTGGEVNASCGLHVHIDMRNRTSEAQRIYKNLVRSQNILEKKVTENRIDGEYSETSHEEYFGNPYVDRKYFAINCLNLTQGLQSKKTIEVRLHHGTLNSKEINNWIRLILSIVKTDKMLPYSPSKRQILSLIKPGVIVRRYLASKKVVV